MNTYLTTAPATDGGKRHYCNFFNFVIINEAKDVLESNGNMKTILNFH